MNKLNENKNLQFLQSKKGKQDIYGQFDHFISYVHNYDI